MMSVSNWISPEGVRRATPSGRRRRCMHLSVALLSLIDVAFELTLHRHIETVLLVTSY